MLLKRFQNLRAGLICVPAVARNVYLFTPVPADELPADRAEFFAQKRLAAGEIEILNRTKLARERNDFIEAQIITPVEALPIEAVLAFHIADRVDEENDERRAGNIGDAQVQPLQPNMFGDAG